MMLDILADFTPALTETPICYVHDRPSAEAPSQTTTAPGKRTWPGLPEAELKLIWESANLHHPVKEEQTDTSKTKRAASSRKKLASQGGRREECGVAPTHPPCTEVACSRKHSAAHEAVIKSRDEAFQVGCQFSRSAWLLYGSSLVLRLLPSVCHIHCTS